jgi:hypothetical protein
MTESIARANRFDRRLIWCGAVAAAAVALSFVQVKTTLGVQVPETRIIGIDPSLVDLSGQEPIWRVWWRARGEIVDVEPQWLVTTALTALLAVFAVGILAAIWFALSVEPEQIDEYE